MQIYLIDDHRLFRDGMVSLLESHNIKAMCADNPKQGLEEIKKLTLDAILLDLRMPQKSGLEVLKDIKASGNQTPVIMLTTSNDEKDLYNCLQAGAMGYLLKDMNPKDLVNALKEAMSGAIVVADELRPILAKFLKSELIENDFDKLTKREQEVACSLVRGSSNKVIARDLGISDGTVKLHVKSILKKLSLSSRVEIAVLMSENNYCKDF